MKTGIRRTCLYRMAAMLLVMFCLFLPDAVGETYIYNFDGEPYTGIWDVSGSYSGELFDLDIDYTVTLDTGGKITGTGDVTGTLYIEKYDVYVDIDMTVNITGSVSQKNGVCLVKLNIKAKGTASYDGGTYNASASETITAEIDPASKEMSGTVKAKVSSRGYSASDTDSFLVSLPDADMNGTSTLTINYSGDKKLSGDGTLLISNGDIYDFIAKGSYNEKKDETTLTLKGDKNTLTIKIDGASGEIKSLKGKVLGQKLEGADITPTP
jgi:hypothetical protein